MPLASPSHDQNQPLSWVVRWLTVLKKSVPKPRVLDFAAGSGRHARYAAGLECTVIAADRDAAALEQIGTGVQLICTDLEAEPWPFEAGTFDAVVVTNFLHRPRLDALAGLLAPGGWLIYQTFAAGNAAFGRPSNPDFLLQPGELLGFAERTGLQVTAYEHGRVGEPAPAVVQRIAGWRALSAEADGPTALN